ncbi:helix-turn-helix domain-containing protein [Brevundimonas variabilis]|uniref:Transcriptional regulator with XRE-family HTH domain n=1 Tax=Brevundimonas variabilis TaxID=74312 RepID=A0A7W9CHH6_9CAUL|nr:helix-turn-helix transcriptional regulator [Brevundimonas variabilis]MBB5745717.1 transcriptional regulator with XRE-family HTH domain [Brevundimonas variabilis]
MSGAPANAPRDGALLSEALRQVRRHRGLTAAETASRMHIAKRTYERFEAGRTRLNMDHIARFARATNCDPNAILMAVVIGAPDFARRCCDNRMATILTIALQKFDARVGDRVSDLHIHALISAVTDMFDGLEATLARDEAAAWLKAGTEDLTAKRPKPGR